MRGSPTANIGVTGLLCASCASLRFSHGLKCLDTVEHFKYHISLFLGRVLLSLGVKIMRDGVPITCGGYDAESRCCISTSVNSCCFPMAGDDPLQRKRTALGSDWEYFFFSLEACGQMFDPYADEDRIAMEVLLRPRIITRSCDSSLRFPRAVLCLHAFLSFCLALYDGLYG